MRQTAFDTRNDLSLLDACRFRFAADFPIDITLHQGKSPPLLVDAVLQAALIEAEQKGGVFNVRIMTSIREPLTSTADMFRDRVFNSLFAVTAILRAKAVYDRDGQDITRDIKFAIWNRHRQSVGRLGNGTQELVLFRSPDALVPGRLRGTATTYRQDPLEFSRVHEFLVQIDRGRNGLGTNLLQQTALHAIVFEAIQNAVTHGVLAVDGGWVRGYFGLGFQKATGEKAIESLLGRVSEDIVQTVFGGKSYFAGSPLLAISVSDIGQGIGQTLALRLPKEDIHQRVREAFGGLSRHEKPGNVTRGWGLRETVRYCGKISATLIVKSGAFLYWVRPADHGQGAAIDLLPGFEHETVSFVGTTLFFLLRSEEE